MASKECKKSIAHNPSTRNLDGPLELSVHTLTRHLTYPIWQKKDRTIKHRELFFFKFSSFSIYWQGIN